ncbi:11880_t:CDS:1, partial [Gigaspora margarita]
KGLKQMDCRAASRIKIYQTPDSIERKIYRSHINFLNKELYCFP